MLRTLGLLLLLGTGACRPAPQADRDAVFEAYFEPQRSLLAYLDVSELPSPMQTGIEAYQAAEYTRAQQYLETFLAQDPEHRSATFFLAMVYMQQGRLEEAAANLQRLLQGQASLYLEYAQWYMALLYLKRGDFLAARRLLGYIEQHNWHYYHKEAIRLQLELQRLEERNN